MKLITRDTDYALRAICFLGKHKGRIIAVSKLVKELKIPRPFLRKNLQALNKKGILESTKGKGGGFSLARSPKKIFLLDVIEAFQGPFRLNECFFKKSVCPHTKRCKLKKKIDAIERFVLKELGTVTIDFLIS